MVRKYFRRSALRRMFSRMTRCTFIASIPTKLLASKANCSPGSAKRRADRKSFLSKVSDTSSSFATLLLTASLSQAPAPPAELPPAPRLRHALILCGHPGDAEHVKTFTDTVRKLGDGLAKTI